MIPFASVPTFGHRSLACAKRVGTGKTVTCAARMPERVAQAISGEVAAETMIATPGARRRAIATSTTPTAAYGMKPVNANSQSEASVVPANAVTRTLAKTSRLVGGSLAAQRQKTPSTMVANHVVVW